MFYKKLIYFLLLIILVCNTTGFSQHIAGFIPNQNQWNKKVIYKTDIKGGAMFLENDGFTFRFVEPIEKYHTHKANGDYEQFIGKLKSHAYKIEFLNSNKKSKISAINPSKMSYNFFYGQDKSKWASGLKKYSTVSYADLYSDINMNCKQSDSELKYEFIILPNANFKDIKLKVSGADKVYLHNEDLIIVTTIGEVIETKPYVFQKVNGKEKEIKAKFIINENIISFQVDDYNKNDTLIIDPTLIFSTYSGSTADNWGFTATYDFLGNVYSGGIVMGIGFPDTLGASIMDFAGGADFPENPTYNFGWDLGIIKYDSLGKGLFATYIGGNGSEMPHSMIVNEFNQLIIFGTTGSTNFPVSLNAYDKTFNGGDFLDYDDVIRFNLGIDIFVTRISEDGSSILASSYVGGARNDGLNFSTGTTGGNSLAWNYGDGARGELITDDLNNIYIGTCTFSDDFPQGIGEGFNPSYSGNLDGIVFKMDYNLSNIVWSSYVGGNQDDAVYSIDVDSEYDVYIAGGTASSNFPVTSNAYDNSYNGAVDGFLAHIKRNGSQIIGSTFYGFTNYDQAFFVRTDKRDNVYITGQTVQSGGALVYNANYNIPNSGQFIAKFKKSIDELIWSTEFGKGDGKTNISPTAFAVDICNRVYLSGWGTDWSIGSTDPNFGLKGMQTTSDAISNVTDGQDFYIIVLLDDASVLDYATFFGEQHNTSCGFSGHDHVDGGTSRFDKYGNIYQSVCASCGGCQSFPTTPDVWSQTNNADNCNNALFKINIHYDFADADFTYQNIGVAPFNASFNNIGTGTSFVWDFGDSSAVSSEVNSQHTYNEAGVYNVTLIAYDPTSCNLSDTIIKQLVVMSDTTYYIYDLSVCKNDFIQIGINPIGDTSISYRWTPSETLSDSTIANPFAFPDETTQYKLTVSNGIVTDTVIQDVIVINTQINVDAGNDTTICKYSDINLVAHSNDMIEGYIWSSNNQFTDTINVDFENSTIISVDTSKYFYVKAFITLCNCQSIDSILVTISELNIQLDSNKFVCSGDTALINAINLNTQNQVVYSWSPSSIIVSENNGQVSVSCAENSTLYGIFTDPFGCTTADSVIISVNKVTIDTIKAELSCFNSCTGKANVQISEGIEPFNYLWSNGDKGFDADSLCNGIISVTVTDSLNCIANRTSAINSNSFININANIQDATCESNCNGKVTITVLDGSEPITYFIDNNQVNNEISDLCQGVYILKVVDSLNCILYDTLIIKLNTNDIVMPNIITPNNDGINDYLLIENECNYQIEFTVFSRWGAIVYNSNSETVQWGGYTNAGVLVSPGVYYYIIKSNEGGDKYSKAGYIHVVH